MFSFVDYTCCYYFICTDFIREDILKSNVFEKKSPHIYISLLYDYFGKRKDNNEGIADSAWFIFR